MFAEPPPPAAPAAISAMQQSDLECLSVGYVLAIGGSPLADMFHFDPNEGFWFLNLGRTLIFTTEAFYHLVFLGCVVLVLRRQFAAALLGAAILSASHPFTGLQLLAVLGVWSMVDRFVVTSDRPPLFFTAGLAALAATNSSQVSAPGAERRSTATP